MANQYDTNLKLQAIADAIGDTSSSGLISALEDIADAVAGGGGGSSAGLVSDNFSETDTYDLGDYCIHNNTMYVCINAITTPGPWDLSDWQATNAGLELSSLNSALTNVQTILSQMFMAGNFKYIGDPYITDVDVWMNSLVDASGGQDVSVSANNQRSLTNPGGSGNNQFIFGWLNSNKRFGWVVVLTFSGMKYGKRNNASTFTWATL